MQNYRKTSHATYDIKYHLVWITKYRKARANKEDSGKGKRACKNGM